MRLAHRGTDDQKQDVSEDRAIVTKRDSTRSSYQNQKTRASQQSLVTQLSFLKFSQVSNFCENLHDFNYDF